MSPLPAVEAASGRGRPRTSYDVAARSTKRKMEDAALAAVSGIAHDNNPEVVAKLLRTAAGRIDRNGGAAPAAPAIAADNPIAAGVARMVDATRGAAVQRLVLRTLDDVPVKHAISIAGVSRATVYRARAAPVDELPYINYRYAHPVKRTRITKGETLATQAWMLAACPAPSGSTTGAPQQHCTCEHLYEEYKRNWVSIRTQATAIARSSGEEMITASGGDRVPEHPRSYNVLLRMKRDIGVRTVSDYWGYFNCALCAALPDVEKEVERLERTAARATTIATARLKLTRLQQHVRIRDHERGWVAAMRADIPLGVLLIHMDFTAIDTKPMMVWSVLHQTFYS